jgi:hypothetical protein
MLKLNFFEDTIAINVITEEIAIETSIKTIAPNSISQNNGNV